MFFILHFNRFMDIYISTLRQKKKDSVIFLL